MSFLLVLAFKLHFNVLFYVDIASETTIRSETIVPGAHVYEYCTTIDGHLNIFRF